MKITARKDQALQIETKITCQYLKKARHVWKSTIRRTSTLTNTQEGSMPSPITQVTRPWTSCITTTWLFTKLQEQKQFSKVKFIELLLWTNLQI